MSRLIIGLKIKAITYGQVNRLIEEGVAIPSISTNLEEGYTHIGIPIVEGMTLKELIDKRMALASALRNQDIIEVDIENIYRDMQVYKVGR